MAKTPKPCEWLTLDEALKRFVLAADGTQGSTHILPLHWHVACRLVVEGGFNPDHITPRPPFVVKRKGGRRFLHRDAASGRAGEATVLGGLKTKDIDVVVDVPGIGPTVAVSIKGALNAFRNLTNRLKEAIGDCTNIHLGYPALVYGFLIAIRANRDGEIPAVLQGRLGAGSKDRSRKGSRCRHASNGEVSEFIGAFHEAIVRLAGRRVEEMTLAATKPSA